MNKSRREVQRKRACKEVPELGGTVSYIKSLFTWRKRVSTLSTEQILKELTIWAEYVIIKQVQGLELVERRRVFNERTDNRDIGRCFACSKPGSCKHHIIQMCHGGPDGSINLIDLCGACHEFIHPWMKIARLTGSRTGAVGKKMWNRLVKRIEKHRRVLEGDLSELDRRLVERQYEKLQEALDYIKPIYEEHRRKCDERNARAKAHRALMKQRVELARQQRREENRILYDLGLTPLSAGGGRRRRKRNKKRKVKRRR